MLRAGCACDNGDGGACARARSWKCWRADGKRGRNEDASLCIPLVRHGRVIGGVRRQTERLVGKEMQNLEELNGSSELSASGEAWGGARFARARTRAYRYRSRPERDAEITPENGEARARSGEVEASLTRAQTSGVRHGRNWEGRRYVGRK